MYKRSDPELKNMLQNHLAKITPGLATPTGVRPFIEMMFNKNFYTGAQ